MKETNQTRLLIYVAWSWLVGGLGFGALFYSKGGVPIQYILPYVCLGILVWFVIVRTEKKIKCPKCNAMVMASIEKQVAEKQKEIVCKSCGYILESKEPIKQ